ncbi:hypothetical protein GCM10009863_45330 [Streptomyces axinellae]|uniref:Uncharacterized protein n=1 Tax=Streptomyces axinellae TaxID=552788 RepID=A0ABN3QG22_9ACTN
MLAQPAAKEHRGADRGPEAKVVRDDLPELTEQGISVLPAVGAGRVLAERRAGYEPFLGSQHRYHGGGRAGEMTFIESGDDFTGVAQERDTGGGPLGRLEHTTEPGDGIASRGRSKAEGHIPPFVLKPLQFSRPRREAATNKLVHHAAF